VRHIACTEDIKMHAEFQLENRQGRVYLQNQGVDGREMLKKAPKIIYGVVG
jgi:virulence-associated protein VapD